MVRKMRTVVAISAVAAGLALTPAAMRADHAWGAYHWARSANPFALPLGNNVNSTWFGYLNTAAGPAPNGWSSPYPASDAIVPGVNDEVVHLSIVPGGTNPKTCKAAAGRVEVCNSRYGRNGWLGIAQIWVSGDHITRGVVKLNDTYFNTATYNTAGWRQMVMCQEIAHTLGLSHQDEAFDNPNLGTCMDYTNNPDRNDGLGNNWYPNQHDFDQLALIYGHFDSAATAFTSPPPGAMNRASVEEPGEWGRQVRANGRIAVFDRDFGQGNRIVTFVIWA